MTHKRKGKASDGNALRRTQGNGPTRKHLEDRAHRDEARDPDGYLSNATFEAEAQDDQRSAVGRFRPRVLIYLPRSNAATRQQVIDALNKREPGSGVRVTSVEKIREHLADRPMGPIVGIVVNEAATEEDSSIFDIANGHDLEVVVLVNPERLAEVAAGKYFAHIAYAAKYSRLYPSGQDPKLFASFVFDEPAQFGKALANSKPNERAAFRTAIECSETISTDVLLAAFDAEMERRQPRRNARDASSGNYEQPTTGPRGHVIGRGDFERPSTRRPIPYEYHHRPTPNMFGEITEIARGLDLLS